MRSIESGHALKFCRTYEDLTEEAVKQILSLSQKSIQMHGRFNVALSSGMTSRGVYSLMSSVHYRNEFDWNNIHFFWVDERWVPVSHASSHYQLAAEVLLTRADIPIENIHPIKTNLENVKQSAENYISVLRESFGVVLDEVPRFDLVLLELAQDGHIASLYQDHEAIVEKNKWVVTVSSDDLEESRVTMTLPIINQAENVLFLVSGREKAEVLRKVLEEEFQDEGLPAQLVRPTRGSLSWIVDEHASVYVNSQSQV